MGELNSIDEAIENLERQIQRHSASSRGILGFLVFLVIIFTAESYAVSFVRVFTPLEREASADLEFSKLMSKIRAGEIHVDDSVEKRLKEIAGSTVKTIENPYLALYIKAGLFVVVFGVMMAVYRFHLTEISKAEHSKLGFMRIRVAANNYENKGFLSDVRASLTNKAFESNDGKAKKIESPLPGHPASDLAVLLAEKMLDSLDLRVKPDSGKKTEE